MVLTQKNSTKYMKTKIIAVRNYTADYIQKQFDGLTKDKKIEVLRGALDYMQQYNGRSNFLCIAMAMGYDNFEDENHTYTKR